MIIQVLQKRLDYKGCPIIIRRIGECFEYITHIQGELYSSHIEARKTFFQRLFLRDYTKDQINKITNYMVAMAQTTIETVLSAEQPVNK